MAKYSKVVNGNSEYYRYQITDPVTGKRHDIRAKTIAQLDEKVIQLRKKWSAHPATEVRVRDYAYRQLEIKRKAVSPETFVEYEEKVRLHILPIIGDMALSSVTADDAEDVMGQMQTQSSSSYRKVYMLLRMIFKAAKRNHLISEDPTSALTSVGGKEANEREALTDEQATTLLAAVEGLSSHLFIMIALYTGMRKEEILGLKWDCVVLDTLTPYIKVRRAWRRGTNVPTVEERLKNKTSRRDINIPPVLAEELRRQKALGASEFVIHGKNGDVLMGSGWVCLWKQVQRRMTGKREYKRYRDGKYTKHEVDAQMGKTAKHNADVQYTIDFKVTPHMLRHTYITNLIYYGVDPKTVQYLAGHKDIKITMAIYAKVKHKDPEKMAEVLAPAFEQMSTKMSTKNK